jgi:hypothetical protein
MGNSIGSMLVQSLRSSTLSSTLVSQTSAYPPSFVNIDELPGVARAYVAFEGIVSNNTVCRIINKSSNITTVSSIGMGDYLIGFKTNTFSNSGYLIAGSVGNTNLTPISSADAFYPIYYGSPTCTSSRARIKTINNVTLSGSPAYAGRVNLLFYK